MATSALDGLTAVGSFDQKILGTLLGKKNMNFGKWFGNGVLNPFKQPQAWTAVKSVITNQFPIISPMKSTISVGQKWVDVVFPTIFNPQFVWHLMQVSLESARARDHEILDKLGRVQQAMVGPKC